MYLGTALDKRELQYGDEYLILAAHYVLDRFIEDRSPALLIDLVRLLEYGLLNSAFNYEMKLLLVRAYYQLGAPQRSIALGASLEIKQIQHDSIGYLVTSELETFLTGTTELADARDIYERNAIETPEMLMAAVRFETYSKISEFQAFYTQVDSSVHRVTLYRQQARLEMLGMRNSAELKMYLAQLDLTEFAERAGGWSDQRDTTLLATFTRVENSLTSDIRGRVFPSSVYQEDILRRRYIAILNVLAALVNNPATITDELVSALSQHLSNESQKVYFLIQDIGISVLLELSELSMKTNNQVDSQVETLLIEISDCIDRLVFDATLDTCPQTLLLCEVPHLT